jgi:biofilm PGA synthesis N-glycosyltransferase PgaC
MLLVPITLALFGFLRAWQVRHVFRVLDIQPRRNVSGFVGYVFVYQILTSAAALRGYGQYLVGARRRWS